MTRYLANHACTPRHLQDRLKTTTETRPGSPVNPGKQCGYLCLTSDGVAEIKIQVHRLFGSLTETEHQSDTPVGAAVVETADHVSLYFLSIIDAIV